MAVGFDGYSISDLLDFTEGLQLFRFLGAPKGQLQGIQELGFVAEFDSEKTKKLVIDELLIIWKKAKPNKPDYYWDADEVYLEPMSAHFRFVKMNGFEREDFEFAKIFENRIFDLLKVSSLNIKDQPDFKFRGFDRAKYT